MNDAQLLKDVKDYLRVDGNEQDLNLTGLITAAKDYIQGATGKDFTFSPMEVLCVKLLLIHWFDKQVKTIPHGVDSLLMKLQY